MLRRFGLSQAGVAPCEDNAQAVWFDLYNPTPEEDREIELALGISVPTREDMDEIQISNRLYHEDGVTYATASIVVGTTAGTPVLEPLTLILFSGRLVTVRYTEPKPIAQFLERASKPGNGMLGTTAILTEMMEGLVNRASDNLGDAIADLDRMARDVFDPRQKVGAISPLRMKVMLKRLGQIGDLLSKLRDSLVSLRRLFNFLAADYTMPEMAMVRIQLQTLALDAEALIDHATFASQRINLLVDAALGLIGVEQNAIIKIFSVASVVFLPPTLIASIYGMNFDVMPELHWTFGYPMALGAMVASAVLPYLFFKYKGWL